MHSAPTEESIRHRAYLLWEADGRPHGRDKHYWHLASAQLPEETAPMASTVASSEATLGKPGKVTRKKAAAKEVNKNAVTDAKKASAVKPGKPATTSESRASTKAAGARVPAQD